MEDKKIKKWIELFWVAKLLERYFNNSASEKEIEAIEKWDVNNSAKEDSNFYKTTAQTDLIWLNIVKELQLESEGTKHKIFKIKYYAAAASIVILLCSSYLLFENNNVSNKTISPIISNIGNTIVDKNKAILTLGDGREINLQNGVSFQNSYLNSDGESVTYQTHNQYNKSNSNQIIDYNYLTIPRGGQFFVQLADKTLVWLNSESQLKFPVNFTEGETRQVELVYGEAYFDVSPSSLHSGSKFKVLNANQNIEVLGTEFNVKAYKDENVVYTTLVEGSVKISSLNGNIKIQPNQQSILNKITKKINLINVDVDPEISWRIGEFRFKGKPLKDIMTIISRWYNVDVEFQDKSLKDIKFTGVLGKHQNLREVLETIKNLSIIKNYELNDEKLILK
ncbi:anti-sigma factor [Formosa agariphila KMM 3901]|uniref:Anti-sigma factor n=1 Tax=Formosa agariphila (strain DSM 15362 / KCTC 12365 / LMG 23005 / KMM 3901 / M-2Alg 35-1) TaxID=1347342 RepID=T2KNM1_FORAG|nr:FecR domain-containing protein [Formosa agariphila]CDF80315.1 anti-sigma factor [Formosa agariphila KMM 3901]